MLPPSRPTIRRGRVRRWPHATSWPTIGPNMRHATWSHASVSQDRRNGWVGSSNSFPTPLHPPPLPPASFSFSSPPSVHIFARSGRGEVRRMTTRGRSLFVFLSEPPPCRVSSTTFHGGGGRDLGRVRGGYRARGGQYQLGEVRAKQNSTNLDGGY
jgi:hypothetical protein